MPMHSGGSNTQKCLLVTGGVVSSVFMGVVRGLSAIPVVGLSEDGVVSVAVVVSGTFAVLGCVVVVSD